jgi:gamma-D-glutamyl-L-lysine dipeptidyl-peptidase
VSFDIRSADAFVSVPVTTGWSNPDAPRQIDEAIVAAKPDMAAWVARLGTPERLDLLGRVETSALLGEPVIVIDERHGWSEVRLPWQPTVKDDRGYPAWLPTHHLVASSSHFRAGLDRSAVIQKRLALGVHTNGDPLMLTRGSYLPVIDTIDNTTELLLPDGTSVRVLTTSCSVHPLPRLRPHGSESDDRLIDVASDMLGLSYLWSGLSGWGVDCSGLVHITNRTIGWTVARDSVDQRAEHGARGKEPQRNELLFFRYRDERNRIHHVGIALDARTMLHAPKTGRVVELLPIATEPYGAELERAELA